MSGVKAQCSSCHHRWITRKPPDEIERPRCAECGAEEPSIEFGVDPSSETLEPQADGSALTRAKRHSKRQTLLDQVDDQLDRLKDTAPAESDETVAYELRESYHEVSAFEAELRRTDDLALEELKEIEAYLESVIETIDEYTDELERQSSLTNTIDDLRARKQTLEADIEGLIGKKERLESEITTVKIQLRDVESESEAFEKGRRVGRENWQITYPCSRCNHPIAVTPGDDAYRAICSFLQQNGWGHIDCVQ